MLLTALILFLLAAIGGATLLSMRLAGRALPLSLALLHGALAAAGLVVLAINVLGSQAPGALPVTALVLLVIAAIGGFVVFSYHLRAQPIPLPLTLVHALIAIVGVVLVLIQVVR